MIFGPFADAVTITKPPIGPIGATGGVAGDAGGMLGAQALIDAQGPSFDDFDRIRRRIFGARERRGEKTEDRDGEQKLSHGERWTMAKIDKQIRFLMKRGRERERVARSK